MAGPYYVSIGFPGNWNTRTGLDSGGNCWLGISGLQKAFDTAAAGEIVYIYGTGDLSKFYNVPYDADNDTTLIDGEAVTWHDGGGIVHITSTTATSPGVVEIELTSGNIVTDGDVITGATSAGTITAHTTIAQKQLDVNTNTGTNAAGFIKFIGVNSSWANDGTRAIIDGNEITTDIILLSNMDLLWFENIEVMDTHGTNKGGFNTSTDNSQGCVFINCAAHDCNDAYGFKFDDYGYGCTFIRCVAYANKVGFSTVNGCHLYFCCARDNTLYGIWLTGLSDTAIGCVAHGNTDVGFRLGSNHAAIINCVADGNLNTGVYRVEGNVSHAVVIGCRITNQSQAGDDSGLDCQSDPIIFGWNYFENNGDAAADNVINDTIAQVLNTENTTTDSNLYSLTNTEQGYVDVSEHDFSTGYTDAGDPDLRRTAITVPWS